MMKQKGIATTLVMMVIVLAFMPAVALAAFVSGSTGADGDFTPTANTVLQIPESGVFNFGIVDIPNGVTVTFLKNSHYTPVTILASGDVTIKGTVSVNGGSASINTPGIGGPGGFDGGIGGFIGGAGYRGQGPGGGGGGITPDQGGSGGGAGFAGGGNNGSYCNNWACRTVTIAVGGSSYGNAGLIPLIGGSGGGGAAGIGSVGGGGGGGGGALLIASSGTIRIDGAITANGGNGTYVGGIWTNGGGGGSGGGIRLVANVIIGEGNISAAGGSSPSGNGTFVGGSGSAGRIRLEAWQITRVANTNPTYTSLVYPASLYPISVPSLGITQINGINTPGIPIGAYRAPDITLPFNTSSPVTVTVSAQNIPAGKTVTVKAMPESGNNVVTATGTLTGNDTSSSVQVQLAISSGTAYVMSASVNY